MTRADRSALARLAQVEAAIRHRPDLAERLAEIRDEIASAVGTPPPGVKDIDPGTLWRLYHDEMLSTKQVAERLGCSASTVVRAMERAGIPAREPGRPMKVRLCRCGAEVAGGRALCVDCRREYWRSRKPRAVVQPKPREVLFEIRGLDASGVAVTGFYGAGTSKDDLGTWVARMFDGRVRVAAVEVWMSVDPEISTAAPRRERIRVERREGRKAA